MKKCLIILYLLFSFSIYAADGDLTTRDEATTLNSTDIIYIMQNPSTSKDDKKITVSNFTTDDDWDDSHNHTTTTLSSIDISADTNLAVSSPITLTDDTIGINDADDDGSTKGAASFDSTDFNAASGNVTIVDDGHAHTTTSLSGIVLADDLDTFSSANLAGRLTDETGDGGGFARANNATFVAPSLGVATGTSLDISGALEVGSSNNVWSTGTGLIVTSLLKTGDRGDVSINSDTSWSVEDDSHPHTGSTLSSIDISDDTNLQGGTSLTLSDDTMNVDDDFLKLGGDVATAGTYDFGESSVVVELPNSAAPTTDATGEIALDTTITDHQPLWQYFDGGENMTIIAIDTSELPATDNEIVKYDAGTDKFVLEADAGGGASEINIQLDPQSAKLPGDTSIGIDAGEFNWRLLCDDTVVEYATWQGVLDDDYDSSTLVVDVFYSMSSATSGDVVATGVIMALTPGDSQDVNARSYDVINSTTDTVPGTAGFLAKLSITMTNDDSIAAGDYFRIALGRDGGNGSDNASGDMEIIGLILRQ